MKIFKHIFSAVVLFSVVFNVSAQNCSTLLVNLGNDKNLICGDSVSLFAFTNYAYPDSASWQWTPTSSMVNEQTQNPKVFPNSTRDYIVKCTTPSGCIMRDTVRVFVSNPIIETGTERIISCGNSIMLFPNTLWQPINQVGTVDLKGVSFLNADSGFVSGYGGKVYKTNDGGSSWTDVSTPGTYDLLGSCFLNTNIGFVYGNNGIIYRTSNAGTTWQNVSSGNAQPIRDMFFVNQTIGFAAGGTGSTTTYIFKTSNGGTSWGSIALPNSNRINGMHFTGLDTGYAVCDLGIIMKTTNSGVIWQNNQLSLNNNLFDVYFSNSQVGFACGEYGLMLKTTNAGQTWVKVNTNTSEHLYRMSFINSSTAYAVGSNGSMIYTYNGGDSWFPIPKQISQNLYGIFCMDENKAFAVGASGTVLKNMNIFASYQWSPSSGIENPLQAYTGFSSSTSGMYKLQATTSNGCLAKDSVFIQVLPANVYANEDRTIVCADEFMLYGDFEWKPVTSNTTKLLEQVIADGNTVQVIYGDSIMKIFNNGETIERFKIGNGSGSLFRSVAHNGNGVYVAGGYSGVLAISKNGGYQWQYLFTGNNQNINKIKFRNNNFGMAACDNGYVLKTIDGGNSWTLINTGFQKHLNSISFAPNGAIYISGQDGLILKSLNDGGSFGAIGNLTTEHLRDVCMLNDQIGFICGNNGTLLKTVNGGVTWAAISTGSLQNYTSVYFQSDNVVYLTGSNGLIFKSIDGGNHWYSMKSNTQQELRSVVFTDNNHGMAVGLNGTILRYDYPNSNNTWVDSQGVQSFTTDAVEPFPSQTTTYYFSMQTQSGCYDIDTVVITVNPLIVSTGGDLIPTCGTPIELHAETNLTNDENITYQWTPSTFLSNPDTSNPICTPLTNVQYVVRISNPNGCEAFDTMWVYVGSTMVSASNDTTIFCGQQTQISVTVNNMLPGTHFEWSPNTSLNNGSLMNPTAFPSDTTVYSVVVTDPNGCTGTDSVKVNVIPLQISLPQSTQLNCGEQIQISPSVNNPNIGLLNWEWTPQTGLNNPNIADPIVSYGGEITYTVVATNQSGECSASATIHIVPLPALITAEICIAGYELNYNRNIVQWVIPPSHVLDSIHVFKKNQFGDIVRQTTVKAQSGNVWIDQHTVPQYGFAEYQISIIDTCGFTTPLSEKHKTMFASLSLTEQNKWKISWTLYEGYSPVAYAIFRSYENKPFEQIATMSGSASSFIDPEQKEGFTTYYVGAIKSDTCYTMVNTYRTMSFSNPVSNRPIFITNDFKIYPKPAIDKINLTGSDLVGADIEIYDSMGQLVYTGVSIESAINIPISHFQKGVFYIRIVNDVRVIIEKFIKI